jgi:hypothetical protein
MTSSDDNNLQGSQVTCRAPGAIIPLKPGFIQKTFYKPGSIFQITIAITIKNRSGKNQRSIFISNSICDFQIKIAITIPFKNRSGKIGDRFSFRNRSAISGSKSDPVFRFEIDPRLKNDFRIKSTDGTQNRIPIFVRESISDFEIKIDHRFSF